MMDDVRNGGVNNRNVNHANNKLSIIGTMGCQSWLRETSGWDGRGLEESYGSGREEVGATTTTLRL
ncbi:hypothetical protein M514_09487 [Trichuris suis]|uniref:Uncharacterized protein n=1 Tax=Trichuris suis TaxID=68888 RepID=A0A085NA12_9BILA|nr:hypothetical protein M513_09487 [Trichuris suis]KFD66308.1 hypothetical protein M514_09487 [Trichuris suis]